MSSGHDDLRTNTHLAGDYTGDRESAVDKAANRADTGWGISGVERVSCVILVHGSPSFPQTVTSLYYMNTKPGIAIHPASDSHSLDEVVSALGSVLIGKETQVRLAIATLIAEGHLLIEDVPGVGKTTLAHALGTVLALPARRVQFTSDLLPGDITGVSIFNTDTRDFDFKPGPVFTSVLLADEINRAPPRAQSALLEAMEEKQVTVDGTSYPLPDHFFVIATQNPTDQLGAYPLPESQLDRFLTGITLGYLDPAEERALLAGGSRHSAARQADALSHPEQITRWREQASRISVSDRLLDYVLALLSETRQPGVAPSGHGLSPRAGLKLVAIARAWALMNHRTMVIPEDVQAVFGPVAGHRLTGSVKAGIRLCQSIIERTPLA